MDKSGQRLLVSCTNERHYLYEGIFPGQTVNGWYLEFSSLHTFAYLYYKPVFSGRAVCEFAGHQNPGFYYVKATFSPDGRFVSSGSRDGKAYIWAVMKKK